MSTFNHVDLATLKRVAETYGVEVEGLKKSEIIVLFEEEGLTWQDYKKLLNVNAKFIDEETLEETEVQDEVVAKYAEKAKAAEPKTLLKMTRKNGTFVIRGYRFTREHPFLVVTEADANYLIEVIGGFAIASPAEAKSFYS